MNKHLHCKEFLENISDYVDGELAQELRIVIEQHMGECENCRIVVDTLQRTIEIVHLTSGDEEMPEDVHKRLLTCLNLPIQK